MFEQLCDNLDFLMNEMRISADELGRRTDIPASTIKKIRNRQNPNPTLTTLLPLAKFFSITLSQLVGDEPLPDKRMKAQYRPNIETFTHVPLLTWSNAIFHRRERESELTIPTENNYSEYTFALLVEDEDWENLAPGTALIIDPVLAPLHRDFVIVHKEGQQLPSLKQLLFDEDQRYLKSVIQGHHIARFTEEYRILGVVVEYKKHLRKNLQHLTSVELEI